MSDSGGGSHRSHSASDALDFSGDAHPPSAPEERPARSSRHSDRHRSSSHGVPSAAIASQLLLSDRKALQAEVDQPADLSVKRERRDVGESSGSSSSGHNVMPGGVVGRHAARDWYVSCRNPGASSSTSSSPTIAASAGDVVMAGAAATAAEGVALDLASKGSGSSQSSSSRHREPGREVDNGSDNDIIVLSDEEAGPRVNGHVNGYSASSSAANDDALSDDERGGGGGGESDGDRMPPDIQELKELTVDELLKREQTIRKLKENLRSEEMKLVLLKKLQLSHQMKENLVVGGSQPSKPPPSSNSASCRLTNSLTGAAPPPLVRGSHGHSGHHKQSLHNPAQQLMIPPPLVRPHNTHGPPPPLMPQRSISHGTSSVSSSSALPANVLLQQSLMRSPNIMGRIPVTTPPSIVLGYPMQSLSQVQSGTVSTTSSPSLLQQQQHHQQQQQQSQHHHHHQSQQGQSDQDRGDSQTPAQRQAAAKLALRKQLEKTLLQIPPPKPPPPEMHFIPNPSNTEFIYLVGLEAIVNFITDGDTPREEDAPKPFTCIQCATDFTPVWKWENTKRGTVICEQCVTSNIKKALKAEHTNRLKTAFVKALQQEQEIEQRMSQVSASPPMPVPSSAHGSGSGGHHASGMAPHHPPPPPPLPPQSSLQQPSVASVASITSSPSLLQLPKMSEPLRQSHVAAAAAASLSAAHQQLLRLPQHQPLPAHMLAPLNPFLAQYQYQVQLGKNPVTSAELQRQYLLDMIPPRSLPQGSINWKT